MKFEPHKWPLVRYFRKVATSAPPENEPSVEPVDDAISRAILDSLKAQGLIPAGTDVRVSRMRIGTPSSKPSASDSRPGIKPPADGNFPWETWAKVMAETDVIPGWAPCRFGNRMPDGRTEFVFGVARGSFGIWQHPFKVCRIKDDSRDLHYDEIKDCDVEQVDRVLTAITHLRSGFGVGVFADRMVAASACEVADRAADWSKVDPANPASWGSAYQRTVDAWAGIDIRVAIDHAHDGESRALDIFERRSTEAVMADRPEKLS